MRAQIRLEGFNEARASLRKLHPQLLPNLRSELKDAGNRTVVPAVKKRMGADKPSTKREARRSGKAEASVRVLLSGSTVFLAGGSARVPYFGWRDFGGDLKPKGKRFNTQKRPFLQRGRYLYPGLDDSSEALINAAGTAFDNTAREVGFNGS